MALKLQVPWNRDFLDVDYDGVTAQIRGFGGPHVQEVGDDVHVRNFFEEANQVLDVSRYRIESSGVLHHNKYSICDDRCIIPHRDVSGEELQLQLLQPQIRNIVLLLESPHRDEYQPGKINCPIAPACGATGHNIDKCLDTVLSKINNSLIAAGLNNPERIVPGCKVIISNPIQFQTSLHAVHGQSFDADGGKWKTLRNNVWRKLWDTDHITQCFRTRLNSYKPSLIINACTGDWGCEGNDPKRRVNEFVHNNTEWQDVPRYETKHPASVLAHK